MTLLFRTLYAAAILVLALIAIVGIAAIGAYYYVAPSLPAVDSLKQVQLQVPLRVYTRDGLLLAEYGEQRRIPLEFRDIPDVIQEAFLAAEDDRFYHHPGVDYQGLLRATFALAVTGERAQGGGTITMQVARNFFLTREKTISRKVREIFLALRIERQLSKQEILTLYLNKIFLGQRAYGVGAAAEVYFGKSVHDLTLAEAATIAGLPKAPSRDNPVSSPDRALSRRAYVLRRMLETGYIDQASFQQANAEPMKSMVHGPTVEVDAPYVGEMARQYMLERYGPEAYTAGYQVTTTVDSRLQVHALSALRKGLIEYDRRHGYRGPLAIVDWPTEDGDPESILSAVRTSPGMRPALVTAVDETGARVTLNDGEQIVLDLEAVKWARPYIEVNLRGPAPEAVSDVLSPGQIVELLRTADGGWSLGQTPDAQGAIVALDPIDGAVVALAGGFDFQASKYNRATQAKRQPGSSFKPFIYSAALENGFTAASIVNDAPVVFEDATLEDTWRPENYSQRFYGPTRLREALVRSRNLVSIRVLRSTGVGPAIRHIRDFGIPESIMPRDLSLALGSINLAPLDIAAAYTVFANGGYRVPAYFIQSVRNSVEEVIEEADPLVACATCEDRALEQEERDREAGFGSEDEPELNLVAVEYAEPVISRQNAYLIADMMRDVIRRGTGRRAMSLGRSDLSGKTGTTNERRDAWFSGFNADLVATVWVGFDEEQSLGAREEGSRTALPIWIDFMGDALKGMPERIPPKPSGLVTVRISPETGRVARANDGDAIFETFRVDHVPERDEEDAPSPYEPEEQTEPLF
jgi:penicillin-binding protein 1A